MHLLLVTMELYCRVVVMYRNLGVRVEQNTCHVSCLWLPVQCQHPDAGYRDPHHPEPDPDLGVTLAMCEGSLVSGLVAETSYDQHHLRSRE